VASVFFWGDAGRKKRKIRMKSRKRKRVKSRMKIN
jgi:hypothetical protein